MYEEDVDFCAALRARGGRDPLHAAAPRSCTCAAGRRRAGAGRGASHYDRSHLAFYEKHAPALGAVAARAGCGCAAERIR